MFSISGKAKFTSVSSDDHDVAATYGRRIVQRMARKVRSRNDVLMLSPFANDELSPIFFGGSTRNGPNPNPNPKKLKIDVRVQGTCNLCLSLIYPSYYQNNVYSKSTVSTLTPLAYKESLMYVSRQ